MKRPTTIVPPAAATDNICAALVCMFPELSCIHGSVPENLEIVIFHCLGATAERILNEALKMNVGLEDVFFFFSLRAIRKRGRLESIMGKIFESCLGVASSSCEY